MRRGAGGLGGARCVPAARGKRSARRRPRRHGRAVPVATASALVAGSERAEPLVGTPRRNGAVGARGERADSEVRRALDGVRARRGRDPAILNRLARHTIDPRHFAAPRRLGAIAARPLFHGRLAAQVLRNAAGVGDADPTGAVDDTAADLSGLGCFGHLLRLEGALALHALALAGLGRRLVAVRWLGFAADAALRHAPVVPPALVVAHARRADAGIVGRWGGLRRSGRRRGDRCERAVGGCGFRIGTARLRLARGRRGARRRRGGTAEGEHDDRSRHDLCLTNASHTGRGREYRKKRSSAVRRARSKVAKSDRCALPVCAKTE